MDTTKIRLFARHTALAVAMLSAVRTMVDGLRGLALNSPNDIVRSDGTLWFTDPSYGFLRDFKDEPRLGDYVYRYDRATDTLAVVADGFDKPDVAGGTWAAPDCSR